MRHLKILCARLCIALHVLALAVLAIGCAVDSPVLEIANPDLTLFQQSAYPILLRDCGFPACHGDTHRFFRVFGPGRTRLVPTMASDEPVTADEVRESFARSVSMLAGERDLLDSLLLRKPLDTDVGGAAHEGTDAWGRNVYYSVSDPAYEALVDWAYSAPPSPPTGTAP
jgi:hypothetical protein